MSIIIQRSRVFESSPSGAAMIVPTVTYVGPGDVVAGAVAWWGLRAYSAASIGGNVVKIRRSSDNTTKVFVSQANGGINTADAFFDGSNYFVDTLYDQTGNGHDLTQATTAKQGQVLLLNTPTLTPTLVFTGLTNNGILFNPFTLAQPFTLNCFAYSPSPQGGGIENLLSNAAGGTTTGWWSIATGAGFMSGLISSNSVASPNTWLTFDGVHNGVSSTLYVDTAISVAGDTTGHDFSATDLRYSDYGDNTGLYGYTTEAGVWSVAFSVGQDTAIKNNQHSYWSGLANFDTATLAWIVAVIANGGSMSAAQAGYVDTLIKGLKADGIWTKLDRLWLFASENQAQALTDIVADALATAVGAPTFNANAGYTGQDSNTPTKYIDTGFNPSTAGGNFALASAHMSIWNVGNLTPATAGGEIGVNPAGGTSRNALYATFADGNVYATIQDNVDTGSLGAPGGTHAGHWMVNRTGASASQVYQNGANFASPNGADAAALANGNIYVLCVNDGGANKGTPNQLAMASIGGGLSSTDASNLYTRLRTYMTSVGVP